MSAVPRVISEPGVFNPERFSMSDVHRSTRPCRMDLGSWTEVQQDRQPSDLSGRVQLPGFGLPLAQKSPFPSATEDWQANPLTVRERMMIGLMATLKDKLGWERKVFDENIVRKWRTEALVPVQLQSAESDIDSNDQESGSGEATEFYGSDRQKQISGRMIDHVSILFKETSTLIN